MHDSRDVLAVFGRFEANSRVFLQSARKKGARARVAPTCRPTTATRTDRVWCKSGNLRMFSYAPEDMPPNAPLVIALHGCTQTSDEYDHGTAGRPSPTVSASRWVYPQQHPANNPKNCFSCFCRATSRVATARRFRSGRWVEHALRQFATDRRKVFVTGLSAGGAMASAMLATYPEVFAGGAIIAGLPYGCASNVQQAFEAMFTEHGHAAQALGDRVRAASRHRRS